MRLLIGGSPCTHWSIAQTKTEGREKEPQGIGWELFKNYLIALEKFKPDFFLYENNKSMSQAIKTQITQELNVNPILINSALVSAQNRYRLYWTNIPEVKEPKDKNLILKDIVMDSKDVPNKFWYYNKTYTLTGKKSGVIATIDAPQWLDIMRRVYSLDSKSPTLNTVGAGNQQAKVLQNGFARKLTPREYARLQTIPENFEFPVSDTQMYKMLGNGWTVDVIAHILSYCPNITTEQLEVLSMYDGMSCGQIALKKLKVDVIKYYATEIDKYAIKTTQYNFPNTIQLGDAFQVRDEDWKL